LIGVLVVRHNFRPFVSGPNLAIPEWLNEWLLSIPMRPWKTPLVGAMPACHLWRRLPFILYTFRSTSIQKHALVPLSTTQVSAVGDEIGAHLACCGALVSTGVIVRLVRQEPDQMTKSKSKTTTEKRTGRELPAGREGLSDAASVTAVAVEAAGRGEKPSLTKRQKVGNTAPTQGGSAQLAKGGSAKASTVEAAKTAEATSGKVVANAALSAPAAKPFGSGRAEDVAASKPRTTKQEQVLTMLSQVDGVSIDAIMKATGWQQHSVRGFFAGTVRKKLGFELTSEKEDGIERRYAIKIAG
jgi:Protein of unknown function (DUF3489)